MEEREERVEEGEQRVEEGEKRGERRGVCVCVAAIGSHNIRTLAEKCARFFSLLSRRLETTLDFHSCRLSYT